MSSITYLQRLMVGSRAVGFVRPVVAVLITVGVLQTTIVDVIAFLVRVQANSRLALVLTVSTSGGIHISNRGWLLTSIVDWWLLLLLTCIVVDRMTTHTVVFCVSLGTLHLVFLLGTVSQVVTSCRPGHTSSVPTLEVAHLVDLWGWSCRPKNI